MVPGTSGDGGGGGGGAEVLSQTLAALVPPAAAAIYLYYSRQRKYAVSSWFGRSELPALNRLSLRVQAALRAEQSRHMRIALIGTSSAWVLFCVVLGEFAKNSQGLFRGAAPRRSIVEDEMLPPSFMLFAFAFLLALRPTDRKAILFVSVLVLGILAFMSFDVRAHTLYCFASAVFT